MPNPPHAYVFVDNDVHDSESYKQYIEKIAPTVAAYGGKYLVRGGEVIPVSGNRLWHRVVLIQFPDTRVAQAWINDPELAPIHNLRKQYATSEMIILTGISD